MLSASLLLFFLLSKTYASSFIKRTQKATFYRSPFLGHEKWEAVQNTPKSDNLLKRRIHDAENTSIMQIIVIRCVKCPQLSRISDLGVFRRYRIYRQLNFLYKSIHFLAYQMKFMHRNAYQVVRPPSCLAILIRNMSILRQNLPKMRYFVRQA